MEKISIVIPVYNSSTSLKHLNEEIDSCFSSAQYEVEKIFVDDMSTDNSVELICEIARSKENIHKIKMIRLKKNSGQQNALFCGLHYASGEYIVTMDDDLQHKAEDIMPMIDRLKEGIDLVYGVHKEASATVRSAGSKLTGYFFRNNFPALMGKRVSSFRAFKRESLGAVLECQYAFIYLSALLLKKIKSVENIEIEKRERVYGQSGYNLRKLITLFIKLNYYYGSLIPEFLKPVGAAYEESDDLRCWELPAKCH